MENDGVEKENDKRIEETVLEILKEADMESVTENKIRTLASERLGLDLSISHRKKLVRRVVESFLVSQQSEEDDKKNEEEEKQDEEEEEEEEEGNEGRRSGKKNYGHDDNGDVILCNLNNRRRVTLQDFKGKTLVSIREFYEKDGKQLPSSKGISLTAEQWGAFRNAVPAIEDAIRKLQES